MIASNAFNGVEQVNQVSSMQWRAEGGRGGRPVTPSNGVTPTNGGDTTRATRGDTLEGDTLDVSPGIFFGVLEVLQKNCGTLIFLSDFQKGKLENQTCCTLIISDWDMGTYISFNETSKYSLPKLDILYNYFQVAANGVILQYLKGSTTLHRRGIEYLHVALGLKKSFSEEVPIHVMTFFRHVGRFTGRLAKHQVGRELVTYSSTYVLVALSIDRYDAITHPMNFSGSWQRARRLVIVAWVLSAVFASPSLYLFSEVEYHCRTQCWLHMPEVIGWELYVWLVALTVFIFPTILITACYVIIVYTIWSKSAQMNAPTRHRAKTNGEKRKGGSGNEDASRRASSRGLIPKAKIKTVKMTLVIVFVFILCWSPYIVYNLMDVHGYIPKDLLALTTLIQSLASLNSAANPLIYCLFSTRICRNLRRIPAINWLVTLFSPCLECARQPLEPAGPFRRYGTEYTTMTSDISSRRSTHNNTRYNPVVLQKDVGSNSVTSTTTYINTELLTYETKKKHESLNRGSVVT
ncbi:unnamed protein product, partial [Meganyctiphanes norvegica]